MTPNNVQLTHSTSSTHDNNSNTTAIMAKLNSLETKVNTIEDLLRTLIAAVNKQDS